MRRFIYCCLVFLPLVSFWGCSSEQASNKVVSGQEPLTIPDRHLLDQPDARMPKMDQLDFAVGRSFFRNPWVQAPASTDARDGLGPLFNAISCASCHISSARGLAPVDGQPLMTHVVRLSVPVSTPGEDQFGPEPNYGGQLQTQSLPGVPVEGKAIIHFSEVSRTLMDGEQVVLRRPELSITQPGYGKLSENLHASVRMAPVLTGLGLLDAVPEQQLLYWADPQDADSDGISGRANRVWDIERQHYTMGRFGWKAEQPSVKQQSAAAFHADIGISSSLFADQNCTRLQADCLHKPSGGLLEISDTLLNRVALYVGNLAVPPATANDEKHWSGRALFTEAGCQKCHRQTLTTGESMHHWLSNKTIYPYTDLLLHDMGDELADNRPVFDASGREWRTPPLWGIGLAKKVAPQTGFLHDGRARNVLEAILWHGGEAQVSREAVEQMTELERQQLVQFVESL